jgi:hypothetical protein
MHVSGYSLQLSIRRRHCVGGSDNTERLRHTRSNIEPSMTGLERARIARADPIVCACGNREAVLRAFIFCDFPSRVQAYRNQCKS